MTNTKKLTGALAFLALIAAIDNFLIVELEPEFEEMVFIDAPATQPPQESELNSQESAQNDFWIDKLEVNHSDFAKFVEATGYVPHTQSAKNERLTSNTDPNLSVNLVQNPPGGSTHANWQQTMESEASPPFVQVNYEDALAYCTWLGKNLPSAAQVEFAAQDARQGKSYSDRLRFLHQEKTLASTWIEQNRHDATAVSTGPSAREHGGNEFSGFLCVKNIEHSKD
ncbi:MAG: SUMF1/EgtB/PvdO family nonheme iron enzyme [Pseudohongiellaceae bacterium]